jgi:mRNA interferase RelE/StbE
MYRIIISESALKELTRLQKPAIRKVGEAIDQLAENPKPSGVKKLKGQKEDLYREWGIIELFIQ